MLTQGKLLKPLIPLVISSIMLLSACVSNHHQSNKNISAITPRAENPYLSEQRAMSRSKRVSDVDYALTFNLTAGESFSATSTLNFALSDNSQPLTVDLEKAHIKSLIVNGKTIKPNYNQWFITLPSEQLKVGHNSVMVSFTRKYSTIAEGLHRFIDPIDGKVYLYSHFEPAAAHKMFALFDQPDLKATIKMTVTTPNDWQVISATKETTVKQQGNKKVWYFDRTLKLSPYNFSLHAGPYKVWEDDSGKYPMRLLVRQSVAKQINAKDWFKYTKNGLKFYENYYGVDYPFRKYDQILVPDFLYGAMENSAAITFAERGFLTNGKMTASQQQRLATVILHEMAHQWFGNLVTMNWWDALWLNESFAAFMQTMATAESTEFTNAWRTFYAGGKQSAYRQDQLITTHPIEVPVPSTANAFDNIDAITYSKGASTLNQLNHLLGKEAFRRGIHNYLVENAYSNAKMDDFIHALADASGHNLDNWKQQWLYKAGVNTILADYSCTDGKVSRFNLVQTADKNFPTLREQRVQIALFNVDKKQVKLTSKAAITYRGKSTQVAALIGQQCPDLVYPNYQDWGFAKVNLDAKSFNTAKHSLAHFSDPLLRSMLWQTLWNSARDGKLPLNEYLKIAMANISKEQDYTILGQALAQISAAERYLIKMLGSDQNNVNAISENLAKLAWQNVITNHDHNKQRRWFRYYRQFAHSKQGLSHLAQILSGKRTVPHLTITQDMRWNIIKTLSRYDFADASALIAKELKKDHSDTGEKAALSANISAPNAAVKAKWLAVIQSNNHTFGKNGKAVPFAKLRTAMSAMYSTEQLSLSKLTANQRISSLAKIDKNNGPIFMRSYAGTLIPALCSEQSVHRLAKAIKTQTTLSAGTRRALLIKHQEDERCLMMKSKLTLY